MKSILLVLSFLCIAILPTVATAQDPPQIAGTWSGNWTPKGGVQDAVTIEIKQDTPGKLAGKFLTPAPMELSKIQFNRTTGVFSAEAMDEKSSKHYKIDAKVKGTELKGTLSVDATVGDLLLIKWTYFGR
jgi:hypothetical protein